MARRAEEERLQAQGEAQGEAVDGGERETLQRSVQRSVQRSLGRLLRPPGWEAHIKTLGRSKSARAATAATARSVAPR